MSVAALIDRIRQQPETVAFDEVMAVIAAGYDYIPTRFRNGDVVNEAGRNEGSCKVFAFARANGLNQAETLTCFGDYYRVDVLENPDGTDHGNIRAFMAHGWDGIAFDGEALTPKAAD